MIRDKWIPKTEIQQRLEQTAAAHAPTEEDSPRPPRTGEWIEQGGSRICEGCLTKRADKNFCEAEIPDDWVPFEFGGKTYYRQLLVEDNDK